MAERKCLGCEKVFRSASGLLTHSRKYHPEIKGSSTAQAIVIGELPRRPLKITINNGVKIARLIIYRFDLPEAVDLIAGVFRQELAKLKR